MKKLNLFIAIVSILSISLTSCLKDPGNPVLTASKSTVAVNEEVTFTLSGVEKGKDFTCLSWGHSVNTSAYTVVSGGCGTCGPLDETITVKFTSAGSQEIGVLVKNCKQVCGGKNDKCKNVLAKATVTVQ